MTTLNNAQNAMTANHVNTRYPHASGDDDVWCKLLLENDRGHHGPDHEQDRRGRS